MGIFRPRLLEAVTASDRMDALCDFIEYWLGPRHSSYGESAQALGERPLPMPLRRLYGYAGRWPDREGRGSVEHTVPALSHQDGLVPLHRLGAGEDGKVIFLLENQGVWDCRTQPEGDDPPVWCHGDHMDEHGGWLTGERLVCDSLSRFLVTLTLQELTLGSRLRIRDEGLKDRFDAERGSAVPVWTNGPYVGERSQDYLLWGDVLVGYLWDDECPYLAANHSEGVGFLTEHQGPVNMIRLARSGRWTLDIRGDGSAQLRYRTFPMDESVEAPAGTLDFVSLVAKLSEAASEGTPHGWKATVYFPRKGQSGAVRGKQVHDRWFVTSLFRRALERATGPISALRRQFATDWPD